MLAFSKGKLSFSGQGRKERNLVVAQTSVAADQWVHFAFTRQSDGRCQVFLDGVEDARSTKVFRKKLSNLDFGPSGRGKQVALELMELRVWNRVFDERVIRERMAVSYADGEAPDALKHRFSGDSENLPLQGQARLVPASSAPALMTTAQAKEQAATFREYQVKVQKDGVVDNGKVMFQRACTACHMVNNLGGNIGPDLSGAGVMGDVALLRNILTPNAALETSYYRHDLKLKDGSLVSGFMASENEKAITIRLIGADDRVIAKSQVASHSISKRSLMPEGLLNGMDDQQVADLFAYLRTLK